MNILTFDQSTYADTTTDVTKNSSKKVRVIDFEQRKPIKVLNEEDVRTIFDSGKYETYEECINDLEQKGYEVDDSIEGNFGIYTEESEEDIANTMKALDMSRKEAIKYLGNSLEKAEESTNDFWNAYNYLTTQEGLSKEEALKRLEEAGHKIPENFEQETLQYTDKDEQRIQEYMEAVGCTREQAIKDLGITPKHKGVIQKGLEAIGNVIAAPFKAIGNAVKSAWEWLFGK